MGDNRMETLTDKLMGMGFNQSRISPPVPLALRRWLETVYHLKTNTNMHLFENDLSTYVCCIYSP